MALALVLLALGAIGLLVGARTAVGAAGGVSRALGASTLPLRVLLFGLHLEVLSVAVVAAAVGATELAAGGAVGAMLVVLAPGLGLGVLVAPRPIASPGRTALAAPALGVAAAALAIADRFVDRLEGGLLVALYATYVFIITGRRPPVAQPEPATDRDGPPDPPGTDAVATAPPAGGPIVAWPPGEGPAPPLAQAGMATVAGLVLLAVAAVALVEGGDLMAEGTRLLPGFVGAAVVGTLAAGEQLTGTIRAAGEGRPEPGIADLFATLGAVPTGALGLAALVRPVIVDSGVTIAFLVLALAYAVVGTAFAVRGRIGRGVGAFLLVTYLAWLVLGTRL